MTTDPHQPDVPPIVIECQKLHELADWAETLLCNAIPMDHCPLEEWQQIIRKWRDQKHAITTQDKRE